MFYLIKQGFENIFRNKLMFIASVLIIATSMITLGIFLIIGENVKSFVNNMKNSQGIVVFLEGDVQDSQISDIKSKLQKIPGVTDITYESKEQALENARNQFFNESNIDLTVGWEENNILPASFTLKVEDLENAKNIAVKAENIEGVDDADFDDETFATITNIADFIRIIVMGIFALLVGVSYLVISNTIKLVLHSRRKEINIMKYIGATDGFVKTPFLIEGIVVGVVGAVVSWFITNQLYQVVISKFSNNNIFEFVPLTSKILQINLIIGILISCIACMMSIKRYLKV